MKSLGPIVTKTEKVNISMTFFNSTLYTKGQALCTLLHNHDSFKVSNPHFGQLDIKNNDISIDKYISFHLDEMEVKIHFSGLAKSQIYNHKF